jgi:hypothetical protein
MVSRVSNGWTLTPSASRKGWKLFCGAPSVISCSVDKYHHCRRHDFRAWFANPELAFMVFDPHYIGKVVRSALVGDGGKSSTLSNTYQSCTIHGGKLEMNTLSPLIISTLVSLAVPRQRLLNTASSPDLRANSHDDLCLCRQWPILHWVEFSRIPIPIYHQKKM